MKIKKHKPQKKLIKLAKKYYGNGVKHFNDVDKLDIIVSILLAML